MCRNRIVVLDCACSKRVIEIFEKIKSCDCVINVLFQKLEVSFCSLCQDDNRSIEKIYNIIHFFTIGGVDVSLYYNEDPSVCVERVFR
jgi:hypothetical protein